MSPTEKDNVTRGFRTAIQGLLGFLAAGGLNEVWQHYLSTHNTNIDPTLLVIIGLVLTGIASWAVNYLEDKTGKSVLPVPKDRIKGDQVLNQGIGTKTA